LKKAKLFKLVPKTIQASDIKTGPVLHKRLSLDLEERIRKLEPVFAEVYVQSHEEWLEGFQRDQDPAAEIRIWEAFAFAYHSFMAKHADLLLPAKKGSPPPAHYLRGN
jgi:hypothetical protein